MMASTSQRRTVSSVRSERVAQRLKQRVEEDQFYEAHQTYKVLYQRYCAQGKKEAALRLLFEGASTLLQHSQWESGTDLAIMFTRHLKQEQIGVTKELLDMISELFLCYSGPKEFATDIPAQFNVKVEVDPREHFMRAALKWSSVVEEGKYKYGHPFLHHLLATTFFKEKQYIKAKNHFLYAGDPESFGALLVEMAGPDHEGSDVIITGAVLQLLVLRDLGTALQTYNTYTHKHSLFSELQGPPFEDFPLLNFIHSLLQACQRGDVAAYKCLRQQYDGLISTLDPDLHVVDYVGKIGVAYFDEPSSSSGGTGQATNGIGGAGLMSLFGGGGGGGREGGGFLENFISNISNAIPDPPFLQDEFVPEVAMINGGGAAYLRLDAPASSTTTAHKLQTTPLTIDDDTLD